MAASKKIHSVCALNFSFLYFLGSQSLDSLPLAFSVRAITVVLLQVLYVLIHTHYKTKRMGGKRCIHSYTGPVFLQIFIVLSSVLILSGT